MSYKLLNLVSNYVSGEGYYINRLELGDSGLNGPVDIRFIDEPGWIENVHSVFFSVNGRDAYYPTSTGGLISTSDTGDLVFFDPSNENGRTLSQLYAGATGGLWVVDGSETQLITADDIDMQVKDIKNCSNLRSSAAPGGYLGIIAETMLIIGCDSGDIQIYGDFDMNSIYKITDLAAGTASSNDAARMVDLDSYMLLSTYDPGSDDVVIPTAGGTGLGSGSNAYVAGDILYASAADTLAILSQGTENQVLTMNSSLLPVWAAAGGGGITDHALLSNLAFGAAGHTGNLPMGGNDIENCGNIKLSTGTGVSNAIDFSTGASNYIQRIVYDAGYATIYRADTMHTWSIGAVEHMHLDTTNLKMFCNLLMNGLPIYGGTAAGNDLYLRSTSNATKGSIMLDSPLDLGGSGTHEIWNDGNDLKFKDVNNSTGKTLTELAAGGMPASPVQGDIIYHNGTNWSRLGAGTNGHFLKTQGASANPVWAAGAGGVTDHGALTGLTDDDHTQYFLANGNRVLNGDLDFDTGLSYAKINFDSNNDYLGYDCSAGNDRFEFKIANVARLTIDTEEIEAYESLNMHGYDITSVDDITMSGAGSIIDMNDGDIDDIDSIQAYDGNGIAVRNSGGALKMEIGQTTDSFKVYNNINMNYNDLEEIAYIDGRDSGNLYIRANSSYNVNLEARGYTLMKWGYLDATHPYHTIQSSDSVPSTGSYYDIGSSTKKFDDLWCVATHVGDCCYAETYCAKCGKDFKIGDNIVHKIVEVCKISGDMMTIPIHAECGNAPLKKIKLQRKVLEEYYGFDEDSGEVEIKYRKKHTKEVVEKTRLSKNVCVNPENGKCYAAKKKLKDGCTVVGKKYYDATGKQEIKENVMIDSYEDEIDLEHVLTTSDEITDTPVFEEIEVEI